MFRRGESEDRQHEPPIHPGEVRLKEGQGAEVTVVGQGARLEGTVVSAGSLRIDGQVKGRISAEGDVLLSPGSHVEADVQAQNVTVAGRFKGNVVVAGKAELARGGRVDGNVTAKTLAVAEGAIFNGQCIMDQQVASEPAQGAARAARTEVAATPPNSETEAAAAPSVPTKARPR